MKFALFMLPTIPAASRAERAALRPIGRNRERYQMMIEEVSRLTKSVSICCARLSTIFIPKVMKSRSRHCCCLPIWRHAPNA